MYDLIYLKFPLLDFKPEDGSESLQKKSAFIEASDLNVHPAFRGLFAKCENHKLIGIDAICTEFIHALFEVYLKKDL